MSHKPNFWVRTLERFRQSRRTAPKRIEKPEHKLFVWPAPHKSYSGHSNERANARRRRQIERGIIQVS